MKENLKYYFHFGGDVYFRDECFQNPSDVSYRFEIRMPFVSDSIEDAHRCDLYAQFAKRDGHIVIDVCSDIPSNGNFAIIDHIKWDEWRKYKMAKSKFVNVPVKDNHESYEPCAEKWDDIFQVEGLPEGWTKKMQGVYYLIKEDKEDVQQWESEWLN